jgi:hypothetical protein
MTTPATLFTAADYRQLHAIVFREDYPGYRPTVIEAPNGDPTARDTGKRYSHVAVKYVDKFKDGWARSVLLDYLWRAHNRATDVAEALGVRPAFMPSFEHGALRVLEYPPMTTSALHTDFDLLTINCYRNMPNKGLGPDEVHMGELGELIGLGPARAHSVEPVADVQHSIVYFAIPNHEAVLFGVAVGDWLKERIARSRYYR